MSTHMSPHMSTHMSTYMSTHMLIYMSTHMACCAAQCGCVQTRAHVVVCMRFWPVCWAALHCVALCCIALHCVALCCIALHCVALCCIVLRGLIATIFTDCRVHISVHMPMSIRMPMHMSIRASLCSRLLHSRQVSATSCLDAAADQPRRPQRLLSPHPASLWRSRGVRACMRVCMRARVGAFLHI